MTSAAPIPTPSDDRPISAPAAQRLDTDIRTLVAVLDHSSDALAVLDAATGGYLYINEAFVRLTGFPREEALRMKPWELRKGGSREETLADFAMVVRDHPRAQIFKAQYSRADGSIMHAETSRVAACVDGRWLILSTGRDITEQVRMEQQLHERMAELARSNQDLERFAYVVSHDLSEPLRMVSSYIRLIRQRMGSQLDADTQEFMGFVTDGAHRMQTLLDDLMLYSRAARKPRRLVPVDLEGVLDDVLRNLDLRIQERAAVVTREPVPRLLVDRGTMVQLFQNLIGNALKFSRKDDTRVAVTCRREGEFWHFCVSDNGIGIDPKYFDRIFMVFQRLHARDAYEGNGVGLSVCARIVENYGGRIWVESEPGQGARFNFTLPVMKDEAS